MTPRVREIFPAPLASSRLLPEFCLTHRELCSFCDWSDKLLWFWFFDSHVIESFFSFLNVEVLTSVFVREKRFTSDSRCTKINWIN